jgi:hypothetical protein
MVLKDGTRLNAEFFELNLERNWLPPGTKFYQMNILNGPRQAIGPVPQSLILPYPGEIVHARSPSIIGEYVFHVKPDGSFYQETVSIRPDFQGRGVTTAANGVIVSDFYNGRAPVKVGATLINENYSQFQWKSVFEKGKVVSIAGSLKGLVPQGAEIDHIWPSTDDCGVSFRGNPKGKPGRLYGHFSDVADRLKTVGQRAFSRSAGASMAGTFIAGDLAGQMIDPNSGVAVNVRDGNIPLQILSAGPSAVLANVVRAAAGFDRNGVYSEAVGDRAISRMLDDTQAEVDYLQDLSFPSEAEQRRLRSLELGLENRRMLGWRPQIGRWRR